jgi:hypothetical protein
MRRTRPTLEDVFLNLITTEENTLHQTDVAELLPSAETESASLSAENLLEPTSEENSPHHE